MGAERTGYVSPRTMSATVEAVIGAVYLDGGVGAARLVVGNLGIWELGGDDGKRVLAEL